MKIHGTVTRTKSGGWQVDAGPYIRMRLKRAFPGQSRQQHSKITLSPTESTARDLMWFCERFPLEMTPDVLEEVQGLADGHRQKEEAVGAILGGTWAPPAIGRTFELRLPLRAYQQQSADIVLATGRLLNTDALGLGKTACAIGTLVDPRTLPAVVVTKAHLISQWVREIAKFAPNLKVRALKGRTPYSLHRGPKGKPERAPDVVVLNYHCLAGWADELGEWARSFLLDEVHEVRRTDSAKYAAAKHIGSKAAFVHGYTATPIMNYSDEAIAILDVIAPRVLGTKEEFRSEWCLATDTARISQPEALGQFLREQGVMLGRTRKDVGRELPPVNRIVLDVEADPVKLSAVQGQAGELARVILELGGFSLTERLQAGQQLLNLLRQATGLAKAPAVAERVKDMLDDGERVVLTGWHRAVYDVWAEMLRPYKPAFYTGHESAAAKDESRRRFMEGETNLLIMSNRSGEGLNGLQGVCRVMVFGELDWSPGVHEQLIGRVNRDGQEEPVFVYYAVADSGSDPIVAGVLGAKKADADGFMGADVLDADAERLSQDKIEELARAFMGAASADKRGPPERPARAAPVRPLVEDDKTGIPTQLGLLAGVGGGQG